MPVCASEASISSAQKPVRLLLAKYNLQTPLIDIKKVIQLVNAPDRVLCVDVFLRHDGSFGFDEFRRDPEDSRGRYNIGHHGFLPFATEEEARAKTTKTTNWFAEL